MGGVVSICRKTDVSSPVPTMADMSSYVDAWPDDSDVKSFDKVLQNRTERVIKTVIDGVRSKSLPIDALIEITSGLFDTYQEVVKIILDYKEDIWKNQELLKLVEDYFVNSFHMSEFCDELGKCLNRARNKELIIKFALHRFEEEDGGGTSKDGGNGANYQEKYSKTLEELKKFKFAEEPFTEKFFQIFQKVFKQQLSMLDNMKLHQSKINKKLKSVKAWRKLSNIIFMTVFTTVVICSVVTAAIAAPPIAAALAAAASVPLGAVGTWFDSLWKRYQDKLKGEGELISSMQLQATVTIEDLKSIRALVDRLQGQIESIMETADFAIREEGAVKFAIEEIKKSMDMFMQNLGVLDKHAKVCSEYITKGRTTILHKMIKYQN